MILHRFSGIFELVLAWLDVLVYDASLQDVATSRRQFPVLSRTALSGNMTEKSQKSLGRTEPQIWGNKNISFCKLWSLISRCCGNEGYNGCWQRHSAQNSILGGLKQLAEYPDCQNNAHCLHQSKVWDTFSYITFGLQSFSLLHLICLAAGCGSRLAGGSRSDANLWLPHFITSITNCWGLLCASCSFA